MGLVLDGFRIYTSVIVVSSILFLLTVLVSTLRGQDFSDQRLAFVTEYLDKLGEKELLHAPESYRVVVWPTFYSPISVRVERDGADFKLIAKKLAGQGGYEVGAIERSTEFSITKRQFERVRSLFRDTGLEGMATRETRFDRKPGDLTVEICLDGAHWIVQSAVNRKHHAVVRYCPSDERLLQIGFELVKLSKLKVKRTELF